MISVVILHLIDSLQKGGAERLLIDSINHLQATHPEVKQFICTLRTKEDEIPVPAGIERISLQLRKNNFFRSVRTLNKFIKEKRVTVVHAHLLDSILFSRLLKGKGVKKVFSYHNFYHDKKFVYYSKWRALAEKITFKRKYTNIYVSYEIKECIEKVSGRPLYSYVLNNFPNPSFHYLYQANNTGALDAVIVANLRKTKNLELVIDELCFLNEYPITIHIYGEGPLRETLEQGIKAANVKVQLHGRHEITSELLSQYDLFLMTSKSEGLPLSLLEAMATGLPALLPDHLPVFKKIASDSSIFYSIAKEGDLSEKLKFLLANKNILRELSKKAAEIASQFSVEKYVSQLLAIYN